jgi:sporulation integral membrane protein YtvI
MVMRRWLYSLAGLAVFLVVTYVLLVYGLPLVLPFAVALLAAELINPIVGLLTFKGRVPRGIAVSFVLLFFVGLLTTAMTIAIARLVVEIQAGIAQLPYLYDIGVDLGSKFAEQFGRVNQSLPADIQEMVAQNLALLRTWANDQLKNLGSVLGVVGSLPTFVTNFLIALIATFFMSRDKHEIGDFLLSLFPKEWHAQIRTVKEEVWSSSMGWAKAQGMLILLTMIQSMIGLKLIGSNYAVLMGLVVGMADVMPILGPAAVFVPWAGYALIFGGPAAKLFGIKLLVLYVIVGGVRQVLEAKVVGDQVGLHPLAILLSLYLGFHFFGALGIVVGPLVTILLKSLVKSGLLPIFPDSQPR